MTQSPIIPAPNNQNQNRWKSKTLNLEAKKTSILLNLKPEIQISISKFIDV